MRAPPLTRESAGHIEGAFRVVGWLCLVTTFGTDLVDTELRLKLPNPVSPGPVSVPEESHLIEV